MVLGGHGRKEAALGYQKQNVITANKNDHKLRGRYAYIMSCFTALYLGKSAFNKGCKAYIGYASSFFYCHSGKPPLEDEISGIFMDASNAVIEAIIEGKNPKEAYEISQKTYREWINHFYNKLYDPMQGPETKAKYQKIMAALITDQEGQRFFWNPS